MHHACDKGQQVQTENISQWSSAPPPSLCLCGNGVYLASCKEPETSVLKPQSQYVVYSHPVMSVGQSVSTSVKYSVDIVFKLV